MAKGKIHEAGATARKEIAIGQGHGFGRYMPTEFREMGFANHKAADDFARIAADVPEPPDATGMVKAARRPRQDNGAVQCLPCRLSSEVIRDYCKARNVSSYRQSLVLEPD